MKDIQGLIPNNFSGTVLVAVHNEKIFKQGFGFADRPNRIPNQIDTRFPTASAGKFFVAIGILKLVEQKKLNLSDTIGSILDFDLHQIDPDITVRQLLTHTSGIPDYFDESTMEEYADLWINFPCYKIRKSKDLLPLFIKKPMMYPRGERFQYNNSGYVILDLIIEKITGVIFDSYLQREVFDVCGMNSTGYFEMDRLPEKCANGYIYHEKTKEYYTNIFSVDSKGTGAGGAFTTVDDIFQLWKFLLSGKLLSLETVKEMVKPQESSDDEYYGYGLWLRKNNETYIPYFEGCDPGVSFVSRYDLESNISITITSNMCNDVWDLESKIYDTLISEPKKL